MIGIAFDLRRTAFVRLDRQTHGRAAKRHHRVVVKRLAVDESSTPFEYGRMCSTGRRHAVSPPSAKDAAISLRIFRRDGSSSISAASDGNSLVQPILKLGSLVILVQAAPVLLSGSLLCMIWIIDDNLSSSAED